MIYRTSCGSGLGSRCCCCCCCFCWSWYYAHCVRYLDQIFIAIEKFPQRPTKYTRKAKPEQRQQQHRQIISRFEYDFKAKPFNGSEGCTRRGRAQRRRCVKQSWKKKSQKNKESKNRLITTAITTNTRRLHDAEVEAHRYRSQRGMLAGKQSRKYPVKGKEFPIY